MRFLDWLLGECEIGWAKTAFLSLAFAIPIMLLTYAPGDYEQTPNRFAVIATGYPFLVLTRWLYWRWRENRLVESIAHGDPQVQTILSSMMRWKPRLWFNYASQASEPVMAAPVAASPDVTAMHARHMPEMGRVPLVSDDLDEALANLPPLET